MSWLQINDNNNNTKVEEKVDLEMTNKVILIRTIQFSIRASLLILVLDFIILFVLYFIFGLVFITLDLILFIESGMLFIWAGISGSIGSSFSVHNLTGNNSDESTLTAVKIKKVTITTLTYSTIAAFLFAYTIILGSF